MGKFIHIAKDQLKHNIRSYNKIILQEDLKATGRLCCVDSFYAYKVQISTVDSHTNLNIAHVIGEHLPNLDRFVHYKTQQLSVILQK